MQQSSAKKTSNTKGIILWILTSLNKQKFSLFAGVILLIVTNWLYVRMPIYFKNSIDIIQAGNLNNQLYPILIEASIVAVLIILVRTMSRVLFFNPSRAIEANIKNEVYEKLSHVPASFYSDNLTGSIISKLNNDIMYIRAMFGFGLLQVINVFLLFTIAPIQMWALSPRLTIYCLVPLAFAFLVARFGIKKMRYYTDIRSKDLQAVSSFGLSVLNGIDVVRSYEAEPWAVENMDEKKLKMLHSSIALIKWRIAAMPLLLNLEELQKILIFTFASIGLASGAANISLGQLVAFLGFVSLLAPPITSLGWLSSLLRQAMVSFNNLYEIKKVAIRPTVQIAPLEQSQLEKAFEQGIEVKNLSFHYPKTTVAALSNISFKIKKGQKIGILGKIGSGKTTLVNCLNQYLDVPKNMISMGGLDINDVSENDWRSIITTISQDSYMFSTTIEENILFGANRQTIGNDKWDFIVETSALKQELKQFHQQELEMVGEKGVTLSGGQKQRIAIARALSSKSHLLVLDNVLSALDYQTEKHIVERIIQDNISEALILVSHRVKIFEKMDWILVLDAGNIIEQGTHKDLLAAGGVYFETWNLQNS